MRVRCNGVEGSDSEGIVIDDGALFEVHGWMVDVVVIEAERPRVM